MIKSWKLAIRGVQVFDQRMRGVQTQCNRILEFSSNDHPAHQSSELQSSVLHHWGHFWRSPRGRRRGCSNACEVLQICDIFGHDDNGRVQVFQLSNFFREVFQLFFAATSLMHYAEISTPHSAGVGVGMLRVRGTT